MVAIAVLAVITAAFGRSFSKIEIGFSWLHPTEILIGIAIIATLATVPPREALSRLREPWIVIPMLVLWAVGALAAMRGISEFGFDRVLNDIGLVEYSILVPLVLVAVRTAEEFRLLVSALVIGGIAAILVALLRAWGPIAALSDLELIEVALSLYVGIYVIWIAARTATGTRIAAWHYPVAVIGIALVAIGSARAAWVAIVVGLALTALLAVRGRRLRTAAVLAALVAAGALFSGPLRDWEGLPQFDDGDTSVDDGDTSGDAASEQTGVVEEVSASFQSTETSQGSNAAWRLDFWGFLVEETVNNPVAGVGFGRPAAFEWDGRVYDARTGDPADPNDVTGPHNSFVNVLYRMGVIGLLAVVTMLAFGCWRLVPLVRAAEGETRAEGVYVLGTLAVAAVVAFFTVALEGPFMGIFFWLFLGLVLVAPRALFGQPEDSREPSGGAA